MPAPHPGGRQSPSGPSIFHRDHIKCRAYMGAFDLARPWLGSLGVWGVCLDRGSPQKITFFWPFRKRDFLNRQGPKQTPQTPKLPKNIISPASRTLAWEVRLLPSSWDRDQYGCYISKRPSFLCRLFLLTCVGRGCSRRS